MIKIYTFLICLFFISIKGHTQTTSLVHVGADNKLIYTPDAKGNIIPDFSAVGYKNGEEVIPNVPTKITLNPISGDNRSRIQAAIDEVSQMPMSSSGFRGAVLLKSGEYKISNSIYIKASGVVLRGVGNSTTGTRLIATRSSKHDLIKITGSGGIYIHSVSSKKIQGNYIPVGTKTFTLNQGHSFSIGDRVILRRKPNQAWIKMLGMDRLKETDPKDYNWTPSDYTINYKRKITAISGNRITLDAPLVDPIDSKYAEGFIMKYSWNARIENIGIENIRLTSSYKYDTDENHGWNAIKIDNTEHAWVKDVVTYYFGYSTVYIGRSSSHISVLSSKCMYPKSKSTGGRKYSFNVNGERNLVKNCFANGGRHDFVTGAKVAGPNVFVHCKAVNQLNDIGPHHRWSTGILFDNVSGNKNQNVQNRVNMGSGHGWAGAQIMFWNCTASKMIHQSPPNHTNWAIGCKANLTDRGPRHKGDPGFWESKGTFINNIPSLYEKQLCDRLGLNDCSGGPIDPPDPCKEVIASDDDNGKNPATNVLDKDLNTRWSAEGAKQWIQFCLQNEQAVQGIKMAFYDGNNRNYIFDILTSKNGSNWDTISAKVISSGKTLNLETFPFTEVKTKYIRIIGHENSVNKWNSYTEVEIIKNTNTNKPPSISLTSPENGALYLAPATINISANASDTDGTVAKVDFYNGTTLLGSDTTSPYSFNWTNVAVGNYSLTAVATDNGNLATTSAVVSVTVKDESNTSTNLALNQPTTTSSIDGAQAVDGNTAPESRWSANNFSQWLEVDLGAVKRINKTEVVSYKDRAYQFSISVATEATGPYIPIVDRKNNTVPGIVSSPITDTFSFVNARYVKIEVIGADQYTGTWVSLVEFRVFGEDIPKPSLGNLALSKPINVSSIESVGFKSDYAVDGDASTRWASLESDPQWIQVDLEAIYDIDRVKITWEAAYGKDYKMEVSDDTAIWRDLKTVKDNTVLVNDHTGISGTGRYIKISGTKRGTPWGYSIYELEVYGKSRLLGSNVKETLSIRSSPNPYDEQATIAIKLVQPGYTTVELINLMGITQAQIYSGHLDEGNHSFTLTKNLPSGAYFCRVTQNGERVNTTIIKK